MTTEQRLAAVERQLRVQRLAVAGLLIALVALVGYGATEGLPDLVRAEGLEIVDSEGRVLMYAGPSKNGGLLTLFNSDGSAIYMAGTGNTGDGFTRVSTRAGATAVMLAGNNELGTGGSIAIWNSAGQGVFLARPDQNQNGTAYILNARGAQVVGMNDDSNGNGQIQIFDRHGKSRTLTAR